ncbi:MAG TPA: hypothetical protein DER56_06275 [Thermosipho africanus]|nr:hypothetical protein [Thermosipho africanus]
MYKLQGSFLGFTDNKTVLQKSKTEKTLSKACRYHEKIMSSAEFILYRLTEGYKPVLVENYSYFSSKTGKKTKPRNDYRLVKKDENSYNEINKTEYDFANFIIKNEFLDEQKRIDFIKTELDKKQAEKQKQLEAEQVEQKRKELAKQKKEEFETWWQTEAIKKIENNCKDIETIKSIYESKGIRWQNYTVKLLVMIDNFDRVDCRQELKDWLHHYNVASIKSFETITGVKLGKTDKEIQAKLSRISKADFLTV